MAKVNGTKETKSKEIENAQPNEQLVKALQHTNKNLKQLQQQQQLSETHFISINIKANEKLLESLKDGK